MSLATVVAEHRQATITKLAREAARILILDVERLPGRARLEHRDLTVEGPFWDLNDWRHKANVRRIPHDAVTQWPRTICFAWRWYDEKQTDFAAEWHEGGHEDAMLTAWQLYDEADIIVGHNIRRADTPWLRNHWAEYGWAAPSPFQQVDTYTIARSAFGMESNSLDALCKRLGLKAKTDKYDAKVAQAAVDGDPKAQAKIERYNRGDIAATTAIYDRLRPHMTTHPHLGLFTGDEHACPNCGGDRWVQVDMDARTRQTTYAGRRCKACGTVVRNSHMKQRVTTRAARSA